MNLHPQTELHRHLDISLRISTMWELARRYGVIGESTTLEGFRSDIVIKNPTPNLKTMLDRFSLVQKVLLKPEDLERVAFETVEDCWNEGTKQVELRFSPGFATEVSGISWQECLDSFKRGVNQGKEKYPEMRAGLICIGTREHGIDTIGKTVDFYLNNTDSFLAIDLAGDEDGFPTRTFESAFLPIRRAKQESPDEVHVTIHAGETGSADSIWEAIESLGAERIGHGIAAHRDPKLLQVLAEKEICLEICPTSNWLTGAVSTLKEHPALEILRAGVPISINTDDPTVFGVTLRSELETCAKWLKFETGDFVSINYAAHRHRFLK